MNIKKILYHRGVGVYLALAFAVLSVILTVILVQIVGRMATEQLQSTVGNGLADLADQTADKLERGMSERYREVRLLARRHELVSAAIPVDDRRHMLETLQENYPHYSWVGIASPDGKVMVAAKGLLEGANVAQQPWFQHGLKGGYLGDAHGYALLEQSQKNPAGQPPQRFIDIAFPCIDANGKVIGVLGAHLPLAWAQDVEKSVIGTAGARQKIESIIVGKNGTVLLGPSELQGKPLTSANAAGSAAGGKTGFAEETWADGKTYLTGYSKAETHGSPELGWTVLVRENVHDAFAPVRKMQWQVFWIGIVAAALFALLGVIAARQITRPLANLSQSIKRIRDSETAELTPIGGYYEIDTLTGSFNALITDLVQKKNVLNELNQSLEKRVEEKTKELEPALHTVRSNEQKIQSIIELVQDAYIAVDRSGRVTDWNSQAEKTFGWRKHEAMGQSLSKLVLPERLRETYQIAIENYSMDGRIDFLNRRIEHTVVNRQGEEFPVEVTIGLVHADDTYFFSAFVHDISERKRIERMKNEFVSTVSHELRTPLTSIRASLALLAGQMAGELPPDARALLGIAHSGCERLVRLVNDILDIEKIESGNMEYVKVEQSLQWLAELAIDAIEAYASEYQVAIVLQSDSDVSVSADRDRMIQVLTNLLSNAIKFSPAGATVEVHIRRHGERALLSVIDHGAGIPDAFRDRMFQKFAQADATDSRQKGGTGLGLSICKSIVEEHDGTISFESEEGKGTTFLVDLPVAATQTEDAGDALAA